MESSAKINEKWVDYKNKLQPYVSLYRMNEVKTLLLNFDLMDDYLNDFDIDVLKSRLKRISHMVESNDTYWYYVLLSSVKANLEFWMFWGDLALYLALLKKYKHDGYGKLLFRTLYIRYNKFRFNPTNNNIDFSFLDTLIDRLDKEING